MDLEQRKLARHALGLPNPQKRSYRNRYVVPDVAPGYARWDAMVAAGEADKIDGQTIGIGGADCFRLKHKAALAVLEPGETLDLEDFSDTEDRS